MKAKKGEEKERKGKKGKKERNKKREERKERSNKRKERRETKKERNAEFPFQIHCFLIRNHCSIFRCNTLPKMKERISAWRKEVN